VRQPWETLLGQFRDHWMLAEFLHGDVPLIGAIKADERWWSLSSGEQAMVLAAEALLRMGECWLAVDEDNRARIDYALRTVVDT
jgi:hypothetical protein